MAQYPQGFPQLNLSFDECFFTNFYMGLQADRPETGRFPGARDRRFVDRCVRCFHRQMEVVRPTLIVTLGIDPLRVLAREVLELQSQERNLHAMKSIRSCQLSTGNSVMSLSRILPCISRTWGDAGFAGYSGLEAEQAMVKAAMAAIPN